MLPGGTWCSASRTIGMAAAAAVLAAAACGLMGCGGRADEGLRLEESSILVHDAGWATVCWSDGPMLAYGTSAGVVKVNALDLASGSPLLGLEQMSFRGVLPSASRIGVSYVLADSDNIAVRVMGWDGTDRPISSTVPTERWFTLCASDSSGARLALAESTDTGQLLKIINLETGKTLLTRDMDGMSLDRLTWRGSDTLAVSVGGADGSRVKELDIGRPAGQMREVLSDATGLTCRGELIAYISTSSKSQIPEGALCIANYDRPADVLAWLAPVNGVIYSLPEWIDDSTLLVVEQGAPGVQGLRVVKMLAVR